MYSKDSCLRIYGTSLFRAHTHYQDAQLRKLRDMECNSFSEHGLELLMEVTAWMEELLYWFHKNKVK